MISTIAARKTTTASILQLALLMLAAAPVAAQTGSLPPPAGIAVDYDQHVKPILASRCFGCHGPTQQQSGLRLDLRQNALRGGDYGVVIVPGRSADSKLIQRVSGDAAGLQMPPTGPLSAEEIGMLRAWIDQGAEMPGKALDAAIDRPRTDPHAAGFLDTLHRNDLAAVRRALAADPSLARAIDGAGSSALMHAAYRGSIETMQALLDAGADVHAANHRKATALHWAAYDEGKLALLLSRGADVNARTVEGRTALHSAAMQPTGNALVRVLLDSKADPNARTLTGQTPLFEAAAASLESMRLLLDHGADPNAATAAGITPLMNVGVEGGVALLVSRGADVRARGKKGETAIANAAEHGDIDGVTQLLAKGADVNVPDYRGYTPLMLAAHYDHDSTAIVQLLLSHGANPSATGEGETAASLAARRGDTELARLLKAAARASAPRNH
jgi:ankyrin repeat protein